MAKAGEDALCHFWEGEQKLITRHLTHAEKGGEERGRYIQEGQELVREKSYVHCLLKKRDR